MKKLVEVKGKVGDGIAVTEYRELVVHKTKDPAMPGEIMCRAVLVDPEGTVIQVLGSRGEDEDRWQAEGAEAVETELRKWAEEVAAKKGFTL